jgi:hypothetical protein
MRASRERDRPDGGIERFRLRNALLEAHQEFFRPADNLSAPQPVAVSASIHRLFEK